MSNKEERYFNFPIQLLNGFMVQSRKCLNNIYDYALYAKTLEYEYGDEIDIVKAAEKFFGTTSGNKQNTYEKGQELHETISENSPKVGLNTSTFFDYYKNEKDDFQNVCLLGFLAIKSILQKKAYCKMNNKFWLSRMDGQVKSVAEYYELSEPIRKYSNRWQLTKIKTELILNWNMEHYSRYTRGFYVSFNLNLEKLIYEAEKRRKSTLEKQRRLTEKIALEKALAKLNETPP